MQAIARTRNGRSSSRSCHRLVAAALVAAGRVLCGRAPEPTAAVIDSQSVKTTESGGPRGYDAGKKNKGRKRHIVTDTHGHMLTGIVHAADIQDNRCRSLAKDWEASIASSEAWLLIASIRQLSRRIARACNPSIQF